MDLSHAFATGIRRWCFRCSPFLFLCSKRVILGVKLLSLRLSSRLLDQVLDEEFTRVGRTTGNNRVHITLPYFARRSLSTNDSFLLMTPLSGQGTSPLDRYAGATRPASYASLISYDVWTQCTCSHRKYISFSCNVLFFSRISIK